MKSYFTKNASQLIMVALIGLLVIVAPPEISANAPLLFAMAVAPFPIQPELTAIAIAYRNEEYIADRVFPRVPVGVKTFKYLKYALADRFTIPNTLVGRKGAPNEVEFSATETEATAADYGLDDPIPQDDIDQAANTPGAIDPLGDAAEGIMDLVLLDREKRSADLAFDDTQFATANKITLAANDRWDVVHADSDPVSDIMTGIDAVVMRPNIMVIGQKPWRFLRSHTKIAAAIFKSGTTAAIATREQVAALFELDEIIVGRAWVNTAKKGQAVTTSRVWGNHCALIRRDSKANTRKGVTFGFTAQYGGRVAGAMPDAKIGLRGGQRVRAGETVKEIITANDLGYFLKTVTS